MKHVRKIELLAPAKNAETGIAAIEHGADAIYIGAPQFSARAAAGNSLDDIHRLIEYAHTYWAKVYVALNTLLYNDELNQAESLIRELYRMDADALIIQDMGITGLDIPPIPLHASTQCDNRSLEDIRLLESAGCSQVVLARELNLDEIKEIATHTGMVIEVFIHGALCVSYSGQCYISQALSGRSANRGECAQYCRLPYTLKDASGKVIQSNKHLLSLKDLNQSEHLEKLLDTGVSSFKIEGRLKDIGYVKNVTAFYRQQLDAIFERRPEFMKASSGETTPFFIPDPSKSFNRGFTSYFLTGRDKQMGSMETPKSLGEPIGNVKDLNRSFFTINGTKTIHNGDGLCYLDAHKELKGFRVNKVEGGKIYPAEMPVLLPGITLYRNFNQEFERMLAKKSSDRKIGVEFTLSENNFGFSLTATDEDFCAATVAISFQKELSQKPQAENLRMQLAKLGNTPFELTAFHNELSGNWFIPSSLLADARRRVIQYLAAARKIQYRPPVRPASTSTYRLTETALDYRSNIANDKAKAFYRERGATAIRPAFELETLENVPLMFTRYCIKYQSGLCPKQRKQMPLKEPLTISSGNNTLQLAFDCRHCEMQISSK